MNNTDVEYKQGKWVVKTKSFQNLGAAFRKVVTE